MHLFKSLVFTEGYAALLPSVNAASPPLLIRYAWRLFGLCNGKFFVWLSKIVFSHWLKLCSAVDKNRSWGRFNIKTSSYQYRNSHCITRSDDRLIFIVVIPIPHYDDVIMGAIASQITSLTIIYSTVYSDADQRKLQSAASLAFVRGIHRGPVNSPHKWPVTRKMFPFDDVIMFIEPRSRGAFSWRRYLGHVT